MAPPVLTVTNVTVVVLSPLHTTWLTGWSTSAEGLTVIVKVLVGPSHVLIPLLKCGVTMIVATTGAVPVFVAMNDGMSPFPLAARPIDGKLFVQVYVNVPPVFILLNTTAAVNAPSQTKSLAG